MIPIMRIILVFYVLIAQQALRSLGIDEPSVTAPKQAARSRVSRAGTLGTLR